VCFLEGAWWGETLVGDLVEGVVDVGVPEFGSFGGFDAAELEVVDVSADSAGDFEVN